VKLGKLANFLLFGFSVIVDRAGEDSIGIESMDGIISSRPSGPRDDEGIFWSANESENLVVFYLDTLVGPWGKFVATIDYWFALWCYRVEHDYATGILPVSYVSTQDYNLGVV